MDITIDLSFFYQLLEMPTHQALWLLFIRGGWIVFLIIFLKIAWDYRLFYLQEKYRQKAKWILLAIDVPKENQQGPKAVEHIFANLAAAQSSGNLIDKYIEGYTQQPFSLEIISLGGYIQFLIRTPEKLRDLVEAAVYAQYPDAEISEVEDYTQEAPTIFPHQEYDLWGSELILYNKDAYPIKTYFAFEDTMAKDARFKDPMAACLEMLGRIGEGEQIWLQIIITPCNQDWKDKGDEEVKKLIGEKGKTKKSIIDQVLDSSSKFVSDLGSSIWGGGGGIGEEKKKEEPPSLMSFLSPGAKEVVTAIGNKISKIGFQTKFRIIYLAKKEFFNKAKAVSGILGAIQQFNTLDKNGFKPEGKTKTGVDYWFVKRRVAARQRRIMINYKKRSNLAMPVKPFILNTEELATLFHFPIAEVRTPLLKKTEMKRGRAPISLPTAKNPMGVIEESSKRGEPPSNLPIIE